ncbi:unnamed protein product [Oppiella nova]|uniref:tRNA pseudouridine synthase n=1 Tax=Oppiella nova TaxID=334625 RepID=A0A7R9QT55_9ACAR|nr:unnamed protein product [Oppiella nova]CAG2173433.1 unnamed protein product [Oppiella nova]
MIGGIIDVGLNRFKYEHMEWLLNNPSHKNWGFQQTVAPAKGLWLLDVHYDQSDLKLYDDLGNKANEFANSYPNYSEIITHDHNYRTELEEVFDVIIGQRVKELIGD